MKKSIILLAMATSVAVLQSCTGDSKANEGMQKPLAMVAGETGEVDAKESGTAPVNAADLSTINYQNMQDAFKGETTASAKYAAYSKKAESEGFHEIAILFSAASASENIHANNHRAVLEDAGQKTPAIKPEFTVKSTKENLEDAIAGEGYEVSTMYPEFLKNASAAGNQLSVVSLNYAYKTEQKHKVYYEKALAALMTNNVKSLSSVYYVCPTCGNTYDNTPGKRCGISMTSSEKFIKIIGVNS